MSQQGRLDIQKVTFEEAPQKQSVRGWVSIHRRACGVFQQLGDDVQKIFGDKWDGLRGSELIHQRGVSFCQRGAPFSVCAQGNQSQRYLKPPLCLFLCSRILLESPYTTSRQTLRRKPEPLTNRCDWHDGLPGDSPNLLQSEPIPRVADQDGCANQTRGSGSRSLAATSARLEASG